MGSLFLLLVLMVERNGLGVRLVLRIVISLIRLQRLKRVLMNCVLRLRTMERVLTPLHQKQAQMVR